KQLIQLSDNHAEQESLLSGQVVDCISNQTNVRLFAKKEFELGRMNKFFIGIQKTFQSKERYLIILHCIQGGMIAVMMAFVSYFLVYFYGKAKVSIGDFALIFVLSMEVGHAMWYTMTQVDDFNQAIGKCKQSLSALMVTREIVDQPDAKTLEIKNAR